MQNNPVIGITVDYQEKVDSYSKYPWFALRRHYTNCLEVNLFLYVALKFFTAVLILIGS